MGYWDMSADDYFNYLGDQKTGPEKIQGGAKKFGDTLSLLEQAGTPFGASQSSLIAPPSNSMGVAQGEWDFLNPVSGPQSAGGPVSPPPFQQSGILQGAINRQGAADDLGIAQQQAINQSTAESILNRRDGLLGSNTVFGGATPQAPQAPQAPQSLIDKILHRFGPAGQGISKFISPVTGAMGDFADWGREQALAGNLSALAPEFSAGVRQAEDARLKQEDAQSMQNYRTGMLEVNKERNRLAGARKPQETKVPRAFTPEEIAEMNPPPTAYMLDTLVDGTVVESIPKFQPTGDQTIFQPATQESLLDVRRRQMNDTYVGAWKKERETLADNEQMISNLKTANNILSAEEDAVETGKLTELLLPLRQWGVSLGWVESDEVKPIEFLNSLYKWIIPRMRVVGSGSTSDGEIKMFSEATAGLGNTTHGNRLIAQYGIQLHEYNKRRNNLRSRELKKEGYDDDEFGDYADRVLGPSYEKIDGNHLDGHGTPDEIERARQQYESIPDGYMYYDSRLNFQIKGSET